MVISIDHNSDIKEFLEAGEHIQLNVHKQGMKFDQIISRLSEISQYTFCNELIFKSVNYIVS